MNKDFKQLRKFLDGDDPFVVGGHQMSDIRKRDRPVPEWTRSDKKVQEVLLRSFPKLATDPKQRAAAARWIHMIYLYFRFHYTHRQTAAELGITPAAVMSLTRSVKRVFDGKRADGAGKLGEKPMGRPRKVKQ